MGAIEEDEDGPVLALGLLTHNEPAQGVHTRSDDGVGAEVTMEPAEQLLTDEQAPFPTVLLKVDGEHGAHTRSLVNVGGTICVKPRLHVVGVAQLV